MFENSYVEYSSLYVPQKSLQNYKTTEPWSKFGKIEEIIVPVECFSLNYTNSSLVKGESLTLIASILPEDATNKNVTWNSDNEDVATVSEEGVVFGKQEGTAHITATSVSNPEISNSCTITVLPNIYKLTYKVDGAVYKEYTLNYGATITPETEPTKEGYTFSGWSEIPATMPTHDVEVNGSFTINKYTIKFVNEDGSVLQSNEVEYGVTPVYSGATPTKASNAQYSYTFAGWTPEIVAVTDNATYTATYSSSVNKYTIKFLNEDGSVLQSSEFEYGSTPVYSGATPTKSATAEYSYTFAGWTPEIVAVTADATYTATYTNTPNQYKLTYKVDGEVYKEYTLNYGEAITPEAEPTKEGYTFSGWSEIPATMPAHDVEVTGSFEVNYYKVSYFVDEELVHQDDVAFGEAIEMWTYDPEDDDLTFNGWIGEMYETMPAHDISYKADITSGIAYIINNPENVLGIYTLDGKKVEKIHQGVYVIRMKDGSTRKFIAK